LVFLYESLSEGYSWSEGYHWDGTLKDAEEYWATNPTLYPGYYDVTIDFNEVPDYLFWLTKLSKDLEFSIKKWFDKGLISWEWKDKTLILHTVEEAPYVQFIIMGVIAAVVIIVAFIYADKIIVKVDEILEKTGISGKVLLGGVGVAAAATGIYLLVRELHKPKGKS